MSPCGPRHALRPPPQEPPDTDRERHEQERAEHVEVLDGGDRSRHDNDEARYSRAPLPAPSPEVAPLGRVVADKYGPPERV
jgi:hypothetical protein